MDKKQGFLAKKQVRNSSIELFKVIGIVLIVISHVVQTLTDENKYITYDDYIVNLSMATTNVQYLVLAMFRYFGSIGNTIFFVSSCWFLLDSEKANKKKMLKMFMDIWIISVIILGITFWSRDVDINVKHIIKSFFPTTFNNNWYMTCYLLFYLVHPILNKTIKQMEQKNLLRCTLVLLFLYVCCNFVKSDTFFTSSLILWVTIYFLVAYMKFYLTDFSNNKKYNLIITLLGILGNFGIILLTNFLGLRISFFHNKLLMWNKNCSPFIIFMIIGIFNIVRNINFKNKVINYISNISLLIYIIHENLILRYYYRPMMWQYVYTNFGYDYILVWTLILVAVVFAFGFLTSVVYQKTIQKLVMLIADKLYFKLVKCYGYFEKFLLQLH